MKVFAELNYLRTAPRKVRRIARLIQKMSPEEAERNLLFLNARAARPLLKLLRSAVANAQHNFNRSPESLSITSITVSGGPTLKRMRMRARGTANIIRRRTSHVRLVLESQDLPRQKKHVRKKAVQKEVPPLVPEEPRKEEQQKPEVKRPSLREFTVKKPPKQSPGFVKRIFRRKSI